MDDPEELSASQQRLEAMLYELGDDGMLLSELDGYLCGILCGPQPVAQDTWLPLVWGGEDFDVPAVDQAELVASVLARHEEIVAELTADQYRPLFEIDESNDDVLWEVWLSGFETAMGLGPASWEKLLNSRKESQAQEAAFALVSLLAASDPRLDEAQADDPDIGQLQQDAPAMIPVIAATLFRAHRLAAPQSPARSPAIGRNDPCPCGSGLKYKRCHGAA